jgi:hypothetical protein
MWESFFVCREGTKARRVFFWFIVCGLWIDILVTSPPPFRLGGTPLIVYLFVKHISHRSFLILIYSIGKVHKRGWMGFWFLVVDLTALSNSLLRRRFLLRRNDNCPHCEGLVLALRAYGMVI